MMNIDFNKLPHGKAIGSGMYGTAYLIKINGKSHVLKIQKILPSQRKRSFKHGIWREIDLYEYINKLPDHEAVHFSRLLDYRVYDNCKHIQKRPFKPDGKFAKHLAKFDKSKWCVDYVIEYKGKKYYQRYNAANIAHVKTIVTGWMSKFGIPFVYNYDELFPNLNQPCQVAYPNFFLRPLQMAPLANPHFFQELPLQIGY